MGGDFEVLSGVGHVLGTMGAQLGCYLGWAMRGAIWVAICALILGGAMWEAIWVANLGCYRGWAMWWALSVAIWGLPLGGAMLEAIWAAMLGWYLGRGHVGDNMGGQFGVLSWMGAVWGCVQWGGGGNLCDHLWVYLGWAMKGGSMGCHLGCYLGCAMWGAILVTIWGLLLGGACGWQYG